MMHTPSVAPEVVIVWTAALLILSILVSKAAARLAIPGLFIFIAIGMITGSEGPGGIYFDDPWEAELLGIFALATIIFTGGFQTKWSSVRAVMVEGAILSIAGVVITAAVVGWCAAAFFKIPYSHGLLLGAILSSTDAPAVFSLLRARKMHLRHRLTSLLELESGSNDPMAVCLTIGILYYLKNPSIPFTAMATMFALQLSLGLLIGYLMARGTIRILRRLTLDHDGLYPVILLASLLLTYGVTATLQGSGFLAVYVMGLVMGQADFPRKRALTDFLDGISWLMQIAMFLVMGLLVTPSALPPVMMASAFVAVVLMFLARPLGVYLTLVFSRLDWKEKALISWTGLRGAVPIVLAIFPLLLGIPQAEALFNVVFCVVLMTVLVQGSTIAALAGWLKLETPFASPSEK